MAEIEEMVRLSIRVPVETRDELAKLASISGLKMSAFLATALVIGGRQLARQTTPEHFITADVMRTMFTAMGIDIEAMARQMGKQFEDILEEVKKEEADVGEERKIA